MHKPTIAVIGAAVVLTLGFGGGAYAVVTGPGDASPPVGFGPGAGRAVQEVDDTAARAVAEAVRIASLWVDEATTLPPHTAWAHAWTPLDWTEETMPLWTELVGPVEDASQPRQVVGAQRTVGVEGRVLPRLRFRVALRRAALQIDREGEQAVVLP